jgi:ABC-type multidrug transport system ATPase subunit
VDLSVPESSIMGLLGPNGAGKTTLVRILATLLRPDAGTATVAGHDVTAEPQAVRAQIGPTPNAACEVSSLVSCSGCWSATTDPASRSSAPLDST